MGTRCQAVTNMDATEEFFTLAFPNSTTIEGPVPVTLTSGANYEELTLNFCIYQGKT